MNVSRARLAVIIADMFAEHGPEATAAALVRFVREEKLNLDYDLLMKDVAAELAKHGTLNASIASARELSQEFHARLKGYLRDLHQAENVYIDNRIDPDLIGGVIIETPETYIDWSLQGKLKALRQPGLQNVSNLKE